jgi:hypothetical protein
MKASCLSATLATLACALFLGVTRADEAVLADGSVRPGTLILREDGRLGFRCTSGELVSQFDSINFASATPPFRGAAPFRLWLTGGQHLTGELVGLDAETVRFRTAWAQEVCLPRDRCAALTHAPGFVTFFRDSFEGELKAWRLSGAPKTAVGPHTSGKRSLRLGAAGQALEYVPMVPLTAGRIGVNFLAVEQPSGGRWIMEWDRGDGQGAGCVMLAGPGSEYTADVSGSHSQTGRLPRTPGWHRLTVEVTPRRLVIGVDEAVLWSGRGLPGGSPIRRLRLACVGDGASGPRRGAVLFDDFSVARAVENLPRPPADPTQDELWSIPGDQLFGEALRADQDRIVFRGAFGTLHLGWGDFRGIYFRRRATGTGKPTVSSGEPSGEVARITLCSGAAPDPDEIEGVVRALAPSRMILEHRDLGKLAIDRGRLQRLRMVSGTRP